MHAVSMAQYTVCIFVPQIDFIFKMFVVTLSLSYYRKVPQISPSNPFAPNTKKKKVSV